MIRLLRDEHDLTVVLIEHDMGMVMSISDHIVVLDHGIVIAEGGPEAQWQSTINQRDGISLAPAATLPEKKQHADLCLRKLNLPFPALVDGMDGAAEAAYQAWPSRVYVIDRDGRVAYNSRLGELDFRPAALDTAISSLVKRGPDARPR